MIPLILALVALALISSCPVFFLILIFRSMDRVSKREAEAERRRAENAYIDRMWHEHGINVLAK